MTAAGRISLAQTGTARQEHLHRKVIQPETAAPVSVILTIWKRRELHWIMAMVHRADSVTGCVDCHWCLQALQDKSIGTEEFISQGLLSLCLRSLAAQDSGLRYNLKLHPGPDGNRASLCHRQLPCLEMT